MGVKEQYRDYVMTGFVKRVEPVVPVRGEGASLWDADGTEYIDCFAGISVTNAGHGNPQIIEAAKAQIDKLVHGCSYVYYVPAGRRAGREAGRDHSGHAAEELLRQQRRRGQRGRHAPGQALHRKRRSSSPSSQQLPRPHLRHALASPATRGRKKGGGPYLPGVAFAPTPYCYRCPFGLDDPESCGLACAERLREVIRLHLSGDVARLHRRAGDGRGRHHRAAGRLLQGRQEDPRRRRHAVHRRRGAVRLRRAPASCSPSSTTASSRTS